MKKWNASISGFSLFPLLLLLVAPSHLSAQPEVSSWQTDRSVYARAYLSDADVPNNPVTSWVHPDGGTSQPAPTYAGIHELSSTANWVYIRTTGLGGHLMGPWYRNTAHTGLFPNFPNNQAAIYRMPRQPGDPAALAPKPLTRGGPIGYFVDGVAMFDSRDAFSFNNATGADVRNGPGRWNRDAYVNERVTFDAALAHQAGGQYRLGFVTACRSTAPTAIPIRTTRTARFGGCVRATNFARGSPPATPGRPGPAGSMAISERASRLGPP